MRLGIGCEGVAVVILFERHQFNYSYVWVFVIGTLFANWYLVVCSSIQGITFELHEEMAANDFDMGSITGHNKQHQAKWRISNTHSWYWGYGAQISWRYLQGLSFWSV